MYTTLDRVRTLSGFDDTTNITNENIKGKIIIASGMIDSAIGYLYSLPLGYRYQNSLTFSGTASTGSLVIAINGVNYTVAVTIGQTPEQIADNFRIACLSSTDFITDGVGYGATVLLISKSLSGYAQVDITSAPDTYITTTIGTRSRRYPVVIEQITAEIATALLFIDEYGVEAQDTGKDGPTRMEVIDATLQKLQGTHESGQSIRIFDEVTYAEIATTVGNSTTSYPNDTSETDPSDPTSPKVRMNKVF